MTMQISAKLHDSRLKSTIKDYMLFTFVGHALGTGFFTPYNILVLRFSWEQYALSLIGGIPIAIVWNYVGYRMTLNICGRVKKAFGDGK